MIVNTGQRVIEDRFDDEDPHTIDIFIDMDGDMVLSEPGEGSEFFWVDKSMIAEFVAAVNYVAGARLK